MKKFDFFAVFWKDILMKIGLTHSRNLFEFTWNSEAASSLQPYYKETGVFL